MAGLDAAVQGYPFESWGLAGPDLLGLSAGGLEALGVRPLGHQELLLEAVEQLHALVSTGTHGGSRGHRGDMGITLSWVDGVGCHGDTLGWVGGGCRGTLSWLEGTHRSTLGWV